jgi:glycerol kinase
LATSKERSLAISLSGRVSSRSQRKLIYALEGAIESTQVLTECNGSNVNLVAVAGSAIKWLRDSMKTIETADEINTLACTVTSTAVVTAFSGLLAPY